MNANGDAKHLLTKHIVIQARPTGGNFGLGKIGHQQFGQLPNAFFAGAAGSGSTPGYGSSSASR